MWCQTCAAPSGRSYLHVLSILSLIVHHTKSMLWCLNISQILRISAWKWFWKVKMRREPAALQYKHIITFTEMNSENWGALYILCPSSPFTFTSNISLNIVDVFTNVSLFLSQNSDCSYYLWWCPGLTLKHFLSSIVSISVVIILCHRLCS